MTAERRDGRFWINGAQAKLVEAVASEHPRWEGEGGWHYMERLAILAALVERKDAAFVLPGENLETGQAPLVPDTAAEAWWQK
jgi:hypothetical protein